MQMRPMLEATDVAASVEFYTRVLGFSVGDSLPSPDGKMGWASLNRDGLGLMISSRHTHDEPAADHDHPPRPVLTGCLYFNVDDVDEWVDSLGDRTPVIYGPSDTDYGMREVGLSDPDGYTLILGCPLPE